ncbi:unnamed protein product [Diatraea saccharalis]|uniref:Uncharacterized protein n=1 Tax=Diatraea saccharalis TaxID=40085 RepID=A0A9N9QSL0_9NEOP|nr:unnamed protein product [Diatraea saccharalis]
MTTGPSPSSLAPATVILAAASECKSPKYLYPTRDVSKVNKHRLSFVTSFKVELVAEDKMTNLTGSRGCLTEKSPALMLLRRKVPDIITEIPLRGLGIDWKGEDVLTLHEECFTAGWHFFYKDDKIYPIHKFLLQRHLRVQFVNIVKMSEWCEALTIKFQKAVAAFGFMGLFDKTSSRHDDGTRRAVDQLHRLIQRLPPLSLTVPLSLHGVHL